MSFSLPSFAKINLHLKVLGRRDDGFHEIFTIFQTVSLCDELFFELREKDIELTCSDETLPAGGSNLIVRAANILKANLGIDKGASIRLSKSIPIGGGLGGGSSNAATALIGLARLWDAKMSAAELSVIADQLGSDVSFFLYGGTAVGSGRGSEIEEIEDFRADLMIIATPHVHVSSAEAYADLGASNLTIKGPNRILNVSSSAQLLNRELTNDFEKTVFARYSEVGRAKQKLLELGAKQASMSGSGASVFGIFDNEETRQTALKALGEEANWRSFAVAAVSRNDYREALGL